jgi:hypothetical protein
MLVVDFMHECELGTWKAVFTHLIRLLYALPGGDHLVATIDNRSVHSHIDLLPDVKVVTADFVKFLHMATESYGDSPIMPLK